MELRENCDETTNDLSLKDKILEQISAFSYMLLRVRYIEGQFAPLLDQSCFWNPHNVETDPEVYQDQDQDEDQDENEPQYYEEDMGEFHLLPNEGPLSAIASGIHSFSPLYMSTVLRKITMLTSLVAKFFPLDDDYENRHENASRADDNNRDNFTTMLCSLSEVDKDDIKKLTKFYGSSWNIFNALAAMMGLNRTEPFPVLVLENLPDENSSEEGECLICYRKISVGETFKKLPCGHIFDKSCIILWLQEKSVCPLCRNELHFDLKETMRLMNVLVEELLKLVNDFDLPSDS